MIFIVAYLSLHFLAYAILLRNQPFFFGEKNIFLYHFVSLILVLVISVIFGALDRGFLKWALGGVALHGIYSLSFLELWALSDGGYSLRILDRIDHAGASADFDSLRVLGASKKKYRLDSLKRLNLITPRPSGEWTLTRLGRALAGFLGFFVWISRQKGAS